MQKISIIGAGSFGTALAQVAVTAGRDTLLWGRNEEVIAEINESHTNSSYLPDITLDEKLRATTDLNEALTHADCILLVVPAQQMRNMIQQCKESLPETTPLILCAKGIELSTGALMSEILAEEVPNNPCLVLSGPTFADELAKGLPTAVTLATEAGKELGQEIAEALHSPTFRPYLSDDVIGVEIGGALKNVIGIACGIVAGFGLGENSRAAIMTRGISEIRRVGEAYGAKPETFMGLSGLGDLTLTCTSLKSRNYSLGFERGQGESLNDVLAKQTQVTEGVATAAALLKFAEEKGLDLPTCQAVYKTLHEAVSIKETIEALMARPLGRE